MKAILLVVLTIFSSLVVQSANRHVVATGNWNNVTTWDGGTTLPSVGDNIDFNGGYTLTVPVGYTTATINSISVNNTNAILLVDGTLNTGSVSAPGTNSTISISSTGTLTATGLFSMQSAGVYHFSNAGTLNVGGDLSFQNGSGGANTWFNSGAINVTGAASFQDLTIPAANYTNTGSFTVGGALSNSSVGVTIKTNGGSIVVGSASGAIIDNTLACYAHSGVGSGAFQEIASALTAYTVTGGGAICSGGTSALGLAGSTAGVSYKLYRGGVTLVETVGGTGAALSFTAQGTAGTYTVTAVSGGCTKGMTGSAVVTVNAVPSISAQPTASTSICKGGSATLSTTITGGASLNYQWQYNNGGVWGDVANGTPTGVTYSGNTTTSLTVTTDNVTTAAATNPYQLIITDAGNGCGGSFASSTANVVVTSDPAISVQPSDDNICSGGTGSLTVTATGGASSLVYQWQYNNGGVWNNVVNGTPAGSVYAGNTSTNLTVTGLTAGAYQYRNNLGSTASGCGGASAVTSNTATINVTADPAISVQPSDDNICLGGTGSLTVTATGGASSLVYQWQYNNGGVWGNVVNGTAAGSVYAGNTSTNLTVTGLTAGAYQYRNNLGSTASGCGGASAVTSNTATINVTADPAISVQPSDDNICLGGTGSLTVTATGGASSLVYQWQYNNGGVWGDVANGTPAGSVYAGNTSTNLTVTGLTAGAYQYRNNLGSTASGCGGASAVTSNTATINVTADPAISVQPSDDNICLGGTGSLTVTATGGASSLVYQWQYNNGGVWNNVVNGTPAGSVYAGNTSTNLTVTGLTAGAYQYRNNLGSTMSGCGGASAVTSNIATINVTADPAISVQPSDDNICLGGTGSLTVTATGGASSLVYQWQYNNGGVWGDVVNGTPAGSVYAGNTGTNLTVTGLTAGAYQYRNNLGSTMSGCGGASAVTSNTATINVTADPAISVQPSDDNICLGGTGSLTVTATGGASSLVYQWQYNNGGVWGNVANGTPAGSVYAGNTTTNLTVTGLTAGAYQYRNNLGSTASGCGGASAVTSNTATINVTADPAISVQPSDDNICLGGTGSLTVTATGGSSSLVYQWQYNNGGVWNNVANGTPAGSVYAGNTSTNLTVTGLTAGAYQYRNNLGSTASGCGGASAVTSNTATINVTADPAISVQPSDDNICLGGTGSLTVTATGGASSLVYQWQYNNAGTWNSVSNGTPAGASYAGNTSDALNVTGLAAGNYQYRNVLGSASSGCGGIAADTSTVVTIHVATDPAVSVQATDGSICINGSHTLALTATGGAPVLNYQWEYDNGGTWNNVTNNTPSGSSYTGANTASLGTSGFPIDGSYNYRCILTATGSGCDAFTSDTSVVVVNPTPTVDAGTGFSMPYGTHQTIDASASGVSYSWSPIDSLAAGNSTIEDPQTINLVRSTVYTLTVTDLVTTCTNTDNIIVTITGGKLDISTLTVDDSIICQGETVHFNVVPTGGSGIYTYNWTANPAGSVIVGANTATPSHNPLIDTRYTLVINDGFNSYTDTSLFITVHGLPTANAGKDIDTCTSSGSIGLNGLATGGDGNYLYLWDNAGSLTDATLSNPGAQPSNTTTYTLLVTDGNGCTDTDMMVLKISPQPIASAGLNKVICKNLNTVLDGSVSSGTPTFAYSWSPTASLSNANTATPTASPIVATTYTLTITDGKGCTTTDDVEVTVNPLPVANAGLDNEICLNTDTVLHVTVKLGTPGYTYLWSPINSLDDKSLAQPRANPIVTTTYTVTITDIKGCTDDDDIILTVNPLPTANAGIDNTVCYKSSNQLTASGGVSYSWSTGDVTAMTTVIPRTTSSYTVTTTDVKGCTDDDEIVLSLFANPVTPAFPGDETVCPGNSIDVSVSSPDNTNYTYKWYSVATGGTPLTASPSYTLTNVTTYTTLYVEAVGKSNGCPDTTRESVNVNLGIVPKADFVVDNPSVLKWEDVHFTNQSTDAVEWLWNFGEGSASSILNNPTYAYQDPSNPTVKLKVWSSDHCVDSIIKPNAVIVQDRAKIFVPTAFTPNGDNKNDVLYVLGEVIKTMTFKIYNQWGVLLFTSSSQSDGWDGTYKGVAQPAANYTFVLSYVELDLNDENTYTLQGVTTLIR